MRHAMKNQIKSDYAKCLPVAEVEAKKKECLNAWSTICPQWKGHSEIPAPIT